MSEASLVELEIYLQPAQHPDIPHDTRLFAQIIVDGRILLQTEAVGRASEKGTPWKLASEFKIPQNESQFTIAVFREERGNTTQRVLGAVEVAKDEIRAQGEGAKQIVPLELRKVNEDGPRLLVTTIFAFSDPPSLPTPPRIEVSAAGQFSIYPEPPLIPSRVQALFDTTQAGGSVDPFEIHLLHSAILLNPLHTTIKASLLNGLGDVCSKFHQTKDSQDLVNAVSIYNDAIREVGGRINPAYWNDLGICSARCFERVGRLVDLNKAVAIFDQLVSSTPDGHADKSSHLSNLGASLQTRFKRLDDSNDLHRSVETLQTAVATTADDHPDKASRLTNLGNALLSRFKRLGDREDLEQSIDAKQKALLLTPDGQEGKAAQLNNLASSFLTRFQRFGDLADLTKCIEIYQQAISLTSHDDPDKPTLLENLAAAHSNRFERLGNVADLNSSIQLLRDAIQTIPDGTPFKYTLIGSLGNNLFLRYERFGDLADLNSSIDSKQQAITLLENGHRDKPRLLVNLGISLLARFEQLGDIEDLNSSVKILQDAATTTGDTDSEDATITNLGIALSTRFTRLGEVSDLNEAIEMHQRAVSLIPDGHPNKSSRLVNLGNCLLTRYSRLGDLTDLNSSIQVMQLAIAQTPDDHYDQPALLQNLANSLSSRYERFRNIADLNRSIEMKQNAISFTPAGHPEKPRYLTNLTTSLLSRFNIIGDVNDLNRSIEVEQEAISSTPDDHPDKPARLATLGVCLLTRFKRLGDQVDLNRSVASLQDAVDKTPAGHPDKAQRLARLGESLSARFEQTKDVGDLQAAFLHYSSAARSPVGDIQRRFVAARHWMQLAEKQNLPAETMDAAKVVIELIPRLTWLGSPIQDRHHRIQLAARAARDAAAIAIANEQYEIATEWVERGLATIWNQILQLRSPVDDLASLHPVPAAKLQALSFQLESSSSRSSDLSPASVPPLIDYHQLAHQRDILIEEIRQLPGFDRSLSPYTIDQLYPAANSGPVAMLNVSMSRCDALIFLPGDTCVLLPLKHLTLDHVIAMRECLYMLRTKAVVTADELQAEIRLQVIPFEAQKKTTYDREYVLACLLADLWTRLVRPVLDALAIQDPMAPDSDVRRIWWCPTGPLAFLPIHAAGIYFDAAGPKLSDYAVSSYTPNLATLLRKSKPTASSRKRQLLTVALPKESGLPGTAREVRAIAKHADGFNILPLLEAEASPGRVSSAMNESTWAHFACHGMQNKIEPTESCLLLSGKTRLTISEIIKLSLKDAELAFLSACETATGDPKLEDEAVHLAAGMLLAGYQGVIATMWRIDDSLAVKVADRTYELLFGKYGTDSKRAAEALHFAIKKVCEEEEAEGRQVSLFYWVPFMHFGA